MAPLVRSGPRRQVWDRCQGPLYHQGWQALGALVCYGSHDVRTGGGGGCRTAGYRCPLPPPPVHRSLVQPILNSTTASATRSEVAGAERCQTLSLTRLHGWWWRGHPGPRRRWGDDAGFTGVCAKYRVRAKHVWYCLIRLGTVLGKHVLVELRAPVSYTLRRERLVAVRWCLLRVRCVNCPPAQNGDGVPVLMGRGVGSEG